MAEVWHIDDLKLSHKDLFEVTNFFQYLFTVYKKKIKVHRGKIYDYPVMYLNYSDTGVVNVLVIKYLQNFLDKFTK